MEVKRDSQGSGNYICNEADSRTTLKHLRLALQRRKTTMVDDEERLFRGGVTHNRVISIQVFSSPVSLNNKALSFSNPVNSQMTPNDF